MTSQRMTLVCLVVCLLVGKILADQTTPSCYEEWSRCTPGTQWLSFLWKNCNDRCKELGKTGGECRHSPSRCWENNQQCYCF